MKNLLTGPNHSITGMSASGATFTKKVVAQTTADRLSLYAKVDHLERMIQESHCGKKTQILLAIQAINDRI